MDKVSFQEAAKQAEVHFNTLRNWRKAGKLNTAEKILENGRELWIVDPTEVVDIARQSRQGLPEPPANYHVDIDGANPANDRSDTQTTPPNVGLAPAMEQNLAFFRESVVRPLVEANERQAARMETMAEELGGLKERVKNLEAQIEAAQAARVAAQQVKPTPPLDTTPKPENAPEPVKKKGVFGFFKRPPKV